MKGRWFKQEVPANAIAILRAAGIGNSTHNSGRIAVLPDSADNWQGNMNNTEETFRDTDWVTILEMATQEQAAEIQEAFDKRRCFWRK